MSDYSKEAWVDTTLEGSEYRSYITENDQKGVRINVTAFLSARFGILYDKALEHHVGALDHEHNTQESTAATFRWFSAVVKELYPNYLHVVVTDSPSIHTQLPDGFCNPSEINMTDGGVNRKHDRLFGANGLAKIFAKDRHLKTLVQSSWKKEDYQAALWDDPRVRSQLIVLEEILQADGHLLLFHPVAHPPLNPIELLWRDMKFDYRVNYTHTEKNLVAMITEWLCPSNEEMLEFSIR